jgi:hypothetical protein
MEGDEGVERRKRAAERDCVGRGEVDVESARVECRRDRSEESHSKGKAGADESEEEGKEEAKPKSEVEEFEYAELSSREWERDAGKAALGGQTASGKVSIRRKEREKKRTSPPSTMNDGSCIDSPSPPVDDFNTASAASTTTVRLLPDFGEVMVRTQRVESTISS